MTSRKKKIARLLARHEVRDSELRDLGGHSSRALIDAFENADGLDAPAERARIVRALGVLGTRGSVDFLIALAEDDSQPGWLRDSAVRALGDTGAPKAVRFLIARLDLDDVLARKNAVLGLAKTDHPKARAALEQVAEGDPSDPVCHAACAALGRIEPPAEHIHREEH